MCDKIKKYLGNDGNDNQKYIERNAQNKNIWIGKNIDVNEVKCFSKQPISGVIKEF